MFKGKRLRSLREEKGMSLSKLRDELLLNYGQIISTEGIRQWELGLTSPNSKYIGPISSVFKVKEGYFFEE